MQMNMIQPSRLTFWRFLFLLSGLLPFFAISQIVSSTEKLGVDLSLSRSWQGLIALLGLMGLVSLLLLASTLRLGSGQTWSHQRERILSLAEFPERFSTGKPWIGILPVVIAVTGFTLVFMVPSMLSLFGRLGWMRFLIFWFFSLMGMWAIKLFRRDTSWLVALIAMVLCQSTLHLLLVYWPRVTDYPFAMGWSETSRF
jgi:hypothetical protein